MSDNNDLTKRLAAGDVHGAADTIQALQSEVAWLKTQMAGLMDYEAEIGDKLAKARAECDRLQGENFRLRRALGVVAGAALKPILSDTHLQFNVLVTFARSTLEVKP